MIGYVTLGTNDITRAAAFYDELLAVIGAGRFMEVEDAFIAWAVAPDKPGLSVTKPFDGKTATVGNGSMVALMVDSPEMVHKLYDKAIELGGEPVRNLLRKDPRFNSVRNMKEFLQLVPPVKPENGNMPFAPILGL